MKRLIILFFAVFFFFTAAPLNALSFKVKGTGSSAEVDNVRVSQEGSRIKFVYDIIAEAGEKETEVDVKITIGCKSYKTRDLHLNGAFGKVKPGKGLILYWNVIQDFPRGLDSDSVWGITTAGGKAFKSSMSDKVSVTEWVDKIGQGSVNWTAGYIEAVGIGYTPDKYIGKPNARSMALNVARDDALQNLVEIARGVQVDSATVVKDFIVESATADRQLNSLVKEAVVVDKQYMSDGTIEVKLRMPLYSKLAKIIMPLAMVSLPSAPTEFGSAQVASITHTGMVVDARGIQARPALMTRVFDEDGREVYGAVNVDREYAVQQGMSGYVRDIKTVQCNQRVTANPVTVKALKTSGAGRSDLIISNADAQQIRSAGENLTFMKKCRVVVVLD